MLASPGIHGLDRRPDAAQGAGPEAPPSGSAPSDFSRAESTGPAGHGAPCRPAAAARAMPAAERGIGVRIGRAQRGEIASRQLCRAAPADGEADANRSTGCSVCVRAAGPRLVAGDLQLPAVGRRRTRRCCRLPESCRRCPRCRGLLCAHSAACVLLRRQTRVGAANADRICMSAPNPRANTRRPPPARAG